MYMKKKLYLLCMVVFIVLFSCGCGEKKYDFQLDETEDVTLTIWGSLTDFPALENIIAEFETIYPNCTVIYRLLDDYENNIENKILSESSSANMFLGYRSIFQTSPALKEYALDMNDYESVGIDMSGLNQTLTDSAKDDDGGQYVIPLGLESRGLAVNYTLLESHGLDVPENYQDFCDVCDALVDLGYIPIQNYSAYCAMQLIYPYVANTIVHGENYETVFASMNEMEEGTSRYLSSAFIILDNFVKNGYISYAENLHVDKNVYEVSGSYDATVMNFMEGNVAFSPTTASCFGSFTSRETLSTDFQERPFEYGFIPAPLAEDGSYGYLQPWIGILINKQAENTNWSRAFVNFLCREENMAYIAEVKGIVPNTEKTINDSRFEKILALDDEHLTNLSMFTNTFYSKLQYACEKILLPFEYLGKKSDITFDDSLTYYTKEITKYTVVDDFSAIADDTALYGDCYKRVKLAAKSDKEFQELENMQYYIIVDNAFEAVSDVSELEEGIDLFVTEWNSVGKTGDEEFIPEDGTDYYELKENGYALVSDIGTLEDGISLYVVTDKQINRRNANTALDYYEEKIK